jgi:hypothetical protein
MRLMLSASSPVWTPGLGQIGNQGNGNWGCPDLTTKQLTHKANGVIFKLTLCAGTTIHAYLYFAAEAEMLVSPQARFTVASAPYEGADGYTHVDMVETKGTLFIS